MIYFTSSWDDGSIYDIRLSDLLLKYNQNATFFIPLNNIERRKVINQKQICQLSRDFEIGAHTVNHKYLTEIPNIEAQYEIYESKKRLETIINKPIFGFCFPGGKCKKVHFQYVYAAGFKYARTIGMFKYQSSKLIMNGFLQAYNHTKFTYLKHLLKRMAMIELIENSISILRNDNWESMLLEIIHKKIRNDAQNKMTIIHLWGHSWELEENKMWKQIESFLSNLNMLGIMSKSNIQIVDDFISEECQH